MKRQDDGLGQLEKSKEKKDLPHRHTIRSLISKFENTDSVFNQAHSGRKSNDSTREDVAATVSGSRLQSSYKMADQVGASQSTIWRVLKKEMKLFPYKLKVYLVLSASTAKATKFFALWFLSQSEGNGFLDNVWWSGECNFPLSASSNRKNVPFWTDDISDVLIFEKPLNCMSITVFAACSMSGMLQLFIFVKMEDQLQ